MDIKIFIIEGGNQYICHLAHKFFLEGERNDKKSTVTFTNI